jgi:transposase InsO family protein
VWLLCTDQRIWSVFSKKRGLSRRPGPAVHDDLVNLAFHASAPNVLWLTDIERHEALLNREEVQDLLLQPVAAGW